MKDPLVSQIRTGCKYGPMSSTLEKQKGIHISFDRNCNVCHVTIMLVGHPPLKLEYPVLPTWFYRPILFFILFQNMQRKMMINCSRVLFSGYRQPRQVYLVPLLNDSQYICIYAVVLCYVTVVQVSPTIGKNYDGYTQYYYEIINGHPDHKKKPPENHGNESLAHCSSH